MKLAQHTGDDALLKTARESATESLPQIQTTTSPRVKEEVNGVMIDW